MRNQILIIKISAFCLGLLLIGIFYSIQRNTIVKINENSSITILQKQDRNTLKLLIQQLNYYILSKIESRVTLLSSVNALFQQIDRYFDDKEIEPIIPCQTLIRNSTFLSCPLQCYGCYNCDDKNTILTDEKSQNLIKLSRLFSEYSLLFNTFQENRLFYVSTNDSQFGFLYPPIKSDPSLRPHSKQWYQNHIASYEENTNQKYFFSELYLSGVTYTYKETITYSLINKITNALDGVVGTDIDAEDQNFLAIPVNTYLYNNKGQIIYRNVESLNLTKTQIYYIHEENNTGFNYFDWVEIENYANNLPYTSNCLFDNYETLCRYNSNYNSPIKIVAKKIPGNLTLMMFTNISFELDLQNKFNDQEEIVSLFLLQLFYVQIGSSIGFIVISMLLVIYIFKPIQEILVSASRYIKQMGNNPNKEIFQIMSQRKQKSSIFSNLQLKILNFPEMISKSQQQKSIQCQMIESFRYSKKLMNQKFYQIPEDVKKLLDQSIQFSQLKLQKQISNSLKKIIEIHQ